MFAEGFQIFISLTDVILNFQLFTCFYEVTYEFYRLVRGSHIIFSVPASLSTISRFSSVSTPSLDAGKIPRKFTPELCFSYVCIFELYKCYLPCLPTFVWHLIKPGELSTG